MPGVGLAIVFVGYTLTYYGLSQISGGNWGLLDLTIPGRWATAQGTPRDAGSKAQSAGKTAGGVAGALSTIGGDITDVQTGQLGKLKLP